MADNNDDKPRQGRGAGQAHDGRRERLAARLRENLRRRKAQARALEAERPAGDEGPPLPKTDPKS